MSFFKCLVTILGTANLQFEDEEAVRKAFQEQFGAEGDRFGLEDQQDETPNVMLQLENVARMLDCKVRVSAEVSPAQPPATINFARSSEPVGVINPTGTQQGWARWKSSARDAIEPIPRFTFGSVSQPATIIPVGGELLHDLGWPDLLKGLVRCKGNLAEALLLMREDLNQEIETSAVDNPVIIARASRLEKIILELEEKAKLQAAKEAEGTSATPSKARGPSPSVPPSPQLVSLSNKNHPFYSPITNPSIPQKGISSFTEQAFLEKIMEASVNNNVHSMVSVGNLPSLKHASLSAIESFSKEYFTTIASKTFNSANKSLHPIRGLTADNFQILQLIWNGTKTTQALGPFATSDAVEPTLWLRSLQEAVRVAQRAPKVDEKLELEKSSNGSPKIDEYIVKLQRHFEHHVVLTIEKKLELATKGLKKHFKHLGTFVEDTAIPEERNRCEREGESFSIETALFIILKEFRSYMGARQNTTTHSSDESSDDESSGKKSKKHSRKRKSRNEKESNSNNNNNNNSRKNFKDKDKADSKDKGSRNNGDETGKPTCHICKAEDHLMNDCPDFEL